MVVFAPPARRNEWLHTTPMSEMVQSLHFGGAPAILRLPE